ncbi:MAG: hypothetical protein J7K38_05760 [Thermoplasmata archaeon]|nr:hypothetical protein [Thermoplasmata archaeon]
MNVKNVLKATLIAAALLVTMIINPAITSHAEKGFVQDIVTIQKHANVFYSFKTTKILVILWLIFCFCMGWITRGWFDKWQETHQGNETLLC